MSPFVTVNDGFRQYRQMLAAMPHNLAFITTASGRRYEAHLSYLRLKQQQPPHFCSPMYNSLLYKARLFISPC